MKNLLLTTAVLCASSLAFGQKEATKNTVDFNRWSVELNVGQNKPEKPFAAGYYSSDPTKYFNFSGVEHFDLGARYMFNAYFGAKLDFAYDLMQNQDGTSSLPFETKQYRVGLQGVVSLGRLLQFESFTKHFGLLAHGGIQVSQLAPQLGINKGVTEDNGGFIIGVTPQLKLAKWVALTGDFTLVSNVRQHLNWDGSNSDQSNNLTGTLFTTSLGLTFYLGKKEQHADWYFQDATTRTTSEKYDDEAVRARLDALERGNVDSDQDGVLDSRDVEPNTIKGLTVDSKGKAFDVNNNGVPDEQEGAAVTRVPQTNNTTDPALMAIIEFEYNIMYYDFNRIDPNKESRVKLKYLIDYLQKNPEVNIRLDGYTDALGTIESNNKLSERRVEKLQQILESFKIDSKRIDTKAKGIDTMYSNTGKGEPLARRVNIIIK